jgi:signal transduction histidine kinase
VDDLCRVLIMVRLAALVLSIPAELQREPWRPEVALAQVGVGLATVLVLMRWRDAKPWFSHPAYMTLDVAATVGMVGVTGTEGPFFSYTLGTAGLAGVVFGRRGAILASTTLVAGYWVVLLAEGAGSDPSFQTLVGRPALYPVFAIAGAALRNLLQREAEHIAALHAARAEVAAQHERARLSRELHDFLGKSLAGLSLGAAGLVTLIGRDKDLARVRAGEFAAATAAAARDARQLVRELRTDTTEGTLAEAVRRTVAECRERTGLRAELSVDDEVRVGDADRHELLCVLREALLNVARHARATTVSVALRRDADQVALVVRDDGRGMPAADVAALLARGSFGVAGMHERMVRVGGSLVIESTPDTGTTVTARLPGGQPANTPAVGATSRRRGGDSGSDRGRQRSRTPGPDDVTADH